MTRLGRQLAVTAIGLLVAIAPVRVRGQGAPTPTGQSGGLTIVVIQGEDAVNVIQQRTAVAAVVEVRDRNDQPVSGALVRFAISSGRGSFGGGAQTLSVTTNAAGRAVATGLTPGSNGLLQLTASASFQGQTAAVTISQTSVTTLTGGTTGAAAGSGGGASGGGASAGGGAAAGAGGAAGAGAAAGAAVGGGATAGGISATALAVVGGAVAGGAVAVQQLTNSEPSSNAATYEGTYSGVMVQNMLNVPGCTFSTQLSGTIFVDLEESPTGTVTGAGGVSGTMAIVSRSCLSGPPPGQPQNHGCCTPDPPIQGTTQSFTFSGGHAGNAGTYWTYEFTGSLNAGQVGGTFTLAVQSPTESGRQSFPMTFVRQ